MQKTNLKAKGFVNEHHFEAYDHAWQAVGLGFASFCWLEQMLCSAGARDQVHGADVVKGKLLVARCAAAPLRHEERYQPLWVTAIVLKKACDTVEHSSAWQALREHGIDEPYIQLLNKAQQPTTSNSAHRRRQQTIPHGAGNEAGRHAQFQLTPTIHHETTTRKVEQRQPRSHACRS